jgi:hypothetical protein
MMTVTREDDFVSRAAGEWRNSSERVITTIHFSTTIMKIN